MKTFERLALTAGGLGYCRPASGTWGSLPPPVIAVLLVYAGAEAWQLYVALALLLVAGTVACLRFGDSAEEAFGKKDPGAVVADEVAGQALTLFGVPWTSAELASDPTRAFYAALAGFVLFRIFDVVKPPPARGIQSRPGGLGIVLDDLVAGVYAAIVTWLVVRYALPSIW
ncbi:MAG: phosphatidylglycerophosphatase A [Phycisphaerae bacterium]|nr:phosphatidylglycerophosphatase A [Phycisphaerae bacterium]